MAKNSKEIDLTLEDIYLISQALHDHLQNHPQTAQAELELRNRLINVWAYWSDQVPPADFARFALRLKRL